MEMVMGKQARRVANCVERKLMRVALEYETTKHGWNESSGRPFGTPSQESAKGMRLSAQGPKLPRSLEAASRFSRNSKTLRQISQ